jgi:simple sugar transport system permease protein
MGQYLMGATLGVWVGYAVEMPPVIHMLVVLLAGFVGGALWAAIPALLKARLGSHEVINTIMLNWIAFHLNDWLVSGPMKAVGPSVERTPFILPTAQLPRLLPSPDRLHLGFFVAILACVFCWWLLWKTTVGFSIRTTGANPDAARYAGIKPERQIILAMMLAGGMAGLAGVIDVQGLTYTLPRAFSSGLAFDAIAVSLLAFNHPIGIIPSALLFGALRTGADIFQIRTQLSKYIISINMALILLFVSAPAIVRWVYRIKSRPEEEQVVPLTRGWGG